MTGQHPTSPTIVVVVPAYNEAGMIRSVVAGLRRVYRDVVVVDDGSVDGTRDALRGTGVHVLRHAVNRGQGAALQTGVTYALGLGADVVVTFDADGQHDVRDIAALAEPVLRGDVDVALGSRFLGSSPDIPWSRRALLKGGVLFTRLLSRVRVTDAHNGLRAYSRRAARSLHITLDGMAHASEMLDQIREGGWRYCEVPVTVRYSAYSLAKGQSSWNAIRIALQLLTEKLR